MVVWLAGGSLWLLLQEAASKITASMVARFYLVENAAI